MVAPDLRHPRRSQAEIPLIDLSEFGQPPLTLPCIPLGQLFQPTAFRSNITDIVKAAFPLFWGVRRG